MYISAISGSCWLFLLCSSSPAALRMGAKYTHREKERERERERERELCGVLSVIVQNSSDEKV